MMGHGHAGKTSLVSAMLYTAGASQRLGRVDDGTATTDYDDEEISRKMSISTGMACAEWANTKINLLDTPGFNMFVHEAKLALRVWKWLLSACGHTARSTTCRESSLPAAWTAIAPMPTAYSSLLPTYSVE